MSKTTITQESGIEFLKNELEICKTKEEFILSFWIFWTENVTLTAREFQKVIASSAINKWFLVELKKEEYEFKLLSSRYNNLTANDNNALYARCVYKLMSRFPISLLQDAKKRELKRQTTKVAGIKIEFSLTNLN